MSGIDYFTIAYLAGHTTPTMIESRYGHLSPRHRQASSMLFGSYMDRLTGQGSAQFQRVAEIPIAQQVAALIGKKGR
jgi:hypothetical protein